MTLQQITIPVKEIKKIETFNNYKKITYTDNTEKIISL